jgi:hypothetical protein
MDNEWFFTREKIMVLKTFTDNDEVMCYICFEDFDDTKPWDILLMSGKATTLFDTDELELSKYSTNEVTEPMMISDKHTKKSTRKLNFMHGTQGFEIETFKGKMPLDLENNIGVAKLEDLKGVYNIDMSGCIELTNIWALEGFEGIIDLRRCMNLKNVDALGEAFVVNLSGCSSLSDVSMLGNVNTLKLSDCGKITDVSALGGVTRLNLSNCIGITDVSALGGVHNLNLKGCSGIDDFTPVENVPSLTR